MTVFYTSSYYGKKQFQASYDLVREALKKLKVDLISPEEGNYLSVIDPETQKRLSHEPAVLHYEAIRQGIHLADAVVIEVSYQDIQLGHEMSLALSEKKPVLVLSLYEDFSKKIVNEYLSSARYSPKTIEAIVQNFLASVRERTISRRFNMFLYPSQLEYLTHVSKKQGMNVSEYIRHLINLDRRSRGSSTEESE